MTSTASTQHEHAEAVLAVAIEDYAPPCAEELFLRMLTARDAAPEGQGEIYADATRDAYLRTLGADGEGLMAQIGASREQIETFVPRLVAAIMARFAEIRAGTVQTGGRA